MKLLALLGITVALAACQAEPEAAPTKPRSETPSPYQGLFGFDIGKPLTLPDCQKKYDDYDKVSKPCKTQDAVYLSADKAPSFLEYNHIDVVKDDKGNVRKVQARFNKWGVDDAKEALKGKFGAPDSDEDGVLIWRYSDYRIVYYDLTESGQVEMESTADAKAEDERFAKYKETEANKM